MIAAWLLVAAAVSYAAIVLVFYLGQRHIVFPNLVSRLDPPAALGYPEFELVHIATSEGLRGFAWWKPPRDDAPVVLAFHGNGDTVASLADWGRLFAARGYGVLLPEYPGYAGNAGSPSEAAVFDGGEAALAWLKEQGVAPARLVLLGESLGSGVVVHLAAQQSVAALVLLSPFDSVASLGAERFPFLPVRALIRDKFDNLAVIGRVTSPILLIHAEGDQVIPVRHARRLLEAAKVPTEAVFVRGSSHEFSARDAGDAVLRFLAVVGVEPH